MKVLVSGFEPFNKMNFNPTQMLLEKLPEQTGFCNLNKVLLPVSFQNSFKILERSIEEHKPDIVICTGLAAKRREISIERVAINIADAKFPDNDGWQPIDQPLDAKAPAAYFSALPCKKIAASLINNGIEADVSNTAGTFVCNQLMFRLLHLIHTQKSSVMGGFIHFPPGREMQQADSELQGMPLEAMFGALLLAIEACVQHNSRR